MPGGMWSMRRLWPVPTAMSLRGGVGRSLTVCACCASRLPTRPPAHGNLRSDRVNLYSTSDGSSSAAPAATPRDIEPAEPSDPPAPSGHSQSVPRTTPAPRTTPLPPLSLHEADLEEKFIRGTGPGGQKVNKTSSTVFLRHVPSGEFVKCQATRSQADNRRVARKWLLAKVDAHMRGADSTVGEKAQRRVKKAKSADKKKRRKYRKLEEAKAGGRERGEHEAEREAGDEGEHADESEHGHDIADQTSRSKID